MRVNTSRQAAYTLLEVLLALGLGLILIGALYAAINIQLHHVEAGRGNMEQSLLVRGLLNRIAGDVAPGLTPLSASSSSGGGSSSSSSSTSSASSSPSSSSTTVVLAMQGDTGRLTLISSQVPPFPPPNSDPQTPVADLRRITYWLAGNGSSPLGLARQEVTGVTSDNTDGNVTDESSFVIAEEVKSLQFQYFDGQTWQDSWDGTPPNGPPLAVAITLAVPDVASSATETQLKYYRHVVAIPTANGLAQVNSVGTSP